MHHLTFDLVDSTDGISTLEFMASTTAEQHTAVMAEVQQVLDWAWRHFPHTHGPVDEGIGTGWDHDLQVQVEAGDWHTVTLTLTGTPGFVEAFFAHFGDLADPD